MFHNSQIKSPPQRVTKDSKEGFAVYFAIENRRNAVERERNSVCTQRNCRTTYVTSLRAIKQEVSYDTSAPSFPTVSDDVKAFDGIDYSKVYKTKEDVGLRPHDRDFIPSRRIFWKVKASCISDRSVIKRKLRTICLKRVSISPIHCKNGRTYCRFL